MSALPTFVPKAPPGHKYQLEHGPGGSLASCSCGKYLGIAKGAPKKDEYAHGAWRTGGISPRDVYDLHKVVLSHRSAADS